MFQVWWISKMIPFYICIFFFRFFSIKGYCKTLNFLCYTVGPYCLSILYTVVCILNPNSQFIHSTPPFPFGNYKFRRRQWHPTPVLLPGKSHGQRSLVGCSPWGHWGSDFTFTFMHWRRKWQPTPVFLPGESQGRRSLVGCHLWGRTESDTTEAT